MKNTLLTLFCLPFAFADVIHTVGPIARGHINGSHKEDLANCYKSSLKLVKENNIRSVVSTFVFFVSYSFSAFIFWKSVLSKTKVKTISKILKTEFKNLSDVFCWLSWLHFSDALNIC